MSLRPTDSCTAKSLTPGRVACAHNRAIKSARLRCIGLRQPPKTQNPSMASVSAVALGPLFVQL